MQSSIIQEKKLSRASVNQILNSIIKLSSPLEDFMRSCGLSETEMKEELSFIAEGRTGNGEMDRQWDYWNVKRVELQTKLREMLKCKRFRRETILKAVLVEMQMQFHVWQAARIALAHIETAKAATDHVDVIYHLSATSTQIRPGDTPRGRWRNGSPWDRKV